MRRSRHRTGNVPYDNDNRVKKVKQTPEERAKERAAKKAQREQEVRDRKRERSQKRIRDAMRDSSRKNFLGNRTMMPSMSKRLTRVSFFGMRDAELERASCIVARDSAFHRYFLRLLHNSADVSHPFARLLQDTCKRALVRMKRMKSNKGAETETLIAAILKQTRFADGRMYALFSDLVRLLYDTESNLIPLSESKVAPRASHEFIASIVRAKTQFNTLRGIVRGDPARAAIIALYLISSESNSDQISNAMSKSIANELGDDSEESGSDSDDEQEQGGSGGKKDRRCNLSLNVTMTMLMQAGEQLVKEAGEATSVNPEIRDYVNEVLGNEVADGSSNGAQAGTETAVHPYDINQAAESFEFFKRLLEVRGYAGSSSWFRTQLAEGKAAIEAIFAFMGRMSNVIGEASMKARHGDGEITDVTTGAKLRDLLPVETLKLAIPEYERLFAAQFAEQTLLVRERTYVDDSGDGPIIFFIDFSGSMAQTHVVMDNATREFTEATRENLFEPALKGNTNLNLFQTASSFALALARYAAHWSRDVIIIPADTRAHSDHAVFIAQRLRNPQELTHQLRELLALVPRGGTAFCAPIYETLNVILPLYQSQGADFRQADIVYVTDGEGEIDFNAACGSDRRDMFYATRQVRNAEHFLRFAAECFPHGVPEGIINGTDAESMLRFLDYAKANPQRASRMRGQFRANAIVRNLKGDCDFDLSLCRMFALFVGDTPEAGDENALLRRKMNSMLFDFTLDCDFNNLEGGLEKLMQQLISYAFYKEEYE